MIDWILLTLSILQIGFLVWLKFELTAKPTITTDEPKKTFGMSFKAKKKKPFVLDDEGAWLLEKKNKTGLEN